MKIILSLFITLSIFAFVQASVLAQTATPMNASPSATPLEISPLESNLSTPAALTTRSPNPKPEQLTANKILTSMPKASFVVLIIVFAVLLMEIFLLISKKGDSEKIPKVTPEVALSEPDKSKKSKTWLSLLILVLLLAAIPLTLILVKQRQEIRKKAVEPTVCCEVLAANMCGPGGLGSFDMKVAEFATEAQCQAYKEAGSSYSYSCNCTEHCTVGSDDHDVNQICEGKPEGKSRCSTSGSSNFQVRIVNQGACGGITTPAPTVPPTTPPTATPTRAPTTPPTATPTTAPTNTPAPLLCNQGPCNTAGASCGSGLVCSSDYGNVCRKNECQIEADCTCKTALSCNQGPCNVANSGCTSGLVCIHDTWFGHDQWVCRTNDCQIESDCICKQAENPPGPTNPPVGAPGQTAKPYVPSAVGQTVLPTPVPTIIVPVIPVAGIDGPTLATVFIGALLLIAGLALAL